jgi:2-aminoadipate transaminase
VIPNFQNPTGITMSFEKRKAVYELAKKYGVLILEDNPYGELRFGGEDLPTIKSMDTEGIVAYCSSFSKILSPGMRVGTLTAPSELMTKIIIAKQVSDVHTNIYFQLICNAFMEKCDADAHIEKIRSLYGRKSSLMLAEIASGFDGRVSYTKPQGGLFMWCELPEHVDFKKFIALTLESKVAVVPGATFLADESGTSTAFRLNFSMPSEEQIVKGIGLLSDVIKKVL